MSDEVSTETRKDDETRSGRVDIHDIALVRVALEHLPGACHYHQQRLTKAELGAPLNAAVRPEDACCGTGAPALARRAALGALYRIQEAR